MEEDLDAVRDFGRLLIRTNPNRRTLLSFCRHLREYIFQGRETYWKTYSPTIERPLPDSQPEFWENQYFWEEFTHPSRRLEPGPNAEPPAKSQDLYPTSTEDEKVMSLLLDME